MKKKNLKLILPLLLALSLFAGCGASEKSSPANDMVVETTAAAALETRAETEDVYFSKESIVADSATGTTAPDTMANQKLIKRVNMEAETESLESLLETVSSQVSTLGGYIEYQQIYNGSLHNNYRHRSAELTIRIPANQLDGFVDHVEGQSNVISYNQSQENVTLTYVATESRVKALETEQERLLELMEKAENMTDLLEIEARLTDVRYELENVASQLRVLSNQVDFATIELYISQVEEYTEVEEQTIWQQITGGFRDNLMKVIDTLTNLLIWLIAHIPQLVLLALLLFVGIRIYSRKQKNRPEKTPDSDNESVFTEKRKERFAKKSKKEEQ